MSIPIAGTFDYVAIVPDREPDGSFKCSAQLREPAKGKENDSHDYRLVGFAPTLQVTDAPPGAGTRAGQQRNMLSCVAFTATTREHSSVAAASFHVHRLLTSSFKRGDAIHLVRTTTGGLAMSVFRAGELVVAVGVVTAVPLGSQVEARIPFELVECAEAVFRERDPGFAYAQLPIEIRIGGCCIVRYGALQTMGPFSVYVEHGFTRDLPGIGECVAISRKGECSDGAARITAKLLEEKGALSIVHWEPRQSPARRFGAEAQSPK
jgi:hypothetical protein